jgi:prepilin-type processing-associated H-X9-DG protein
MTDSDGKLIHFFRLQNTLAAGAEVSLTETLIDQKRPVFVIGTDPRCNLQLNDPKVAPAHATVAYKEGQFVIRPQFPKLTVLVNNKAVNGVQALKPGDSVQIGDTLLGFGQERYAGERPVPPSHQNLLTAMETQEQVSEVLREVQRQVFTGEIVVSARLVAPPPTPEVVKGKPAADKTVYIPAAEARQIYFPGGSQSAKKESSFVGILFGLITVVALVGMSSFGAISGLFAGPNQTQLNVAYADGNVSLVMFDADW